MIRYAGKEIAQRAVERWGGDPNSLRHLSDSGNSVYAYQQDGTGWILRLTDPSYRNKTHLIAEADFLKHLRDSSVRVSYAVPSCTGQWVEEVGADEESFLACVFTYTPGIAVDRGSAYWKRPFFVEWGQALGKVHRAAEVYRPRETERRWRWEEEGWIAHAFDLIPEVDALSRRELRELMEVIHGFEETPKVYGLIHADFAPQNFRFSPEGGTITAFDFGNCCYHFYLSDVAISLSTLRREDNREELKEWLLAGYRSIRELKPEFEEELEWLMRLRVVYVYLSRLFKFGKRPNDQEQQILAVLRSRVHERRGW